MIQVTTNLYPLGQGHKYVHQGDLGTVDVNIVSVDPGSGLATEATQQLILTELQDINASTSGSFSIQQLQGWTLTPGNSLVYTYYTGITPENPSGATTNVETIEYFQGATLVLTQTFAYNMANGVLSVTAS